MQVLTRLKAGDNDTSDYDDDGLNDIPMDIHK